MKKNNSRLYIFIAIIIAFFIYSKFNKDEKSDTVNLTKNEIIEKKPILEYLGDKYYSNWEEPSTNDFALLTKILSKNNTSNCSNFFVNKVRDDEYIIACTDDELNFRYFVVWLFSQKSGELAPDVIKVYKEPETFKNEQK
ncbi:MAG: hypothetical protein H7195_08065 [Chryseobacterium sp.]|nr:hypothetical protein [Chryseobacterium sp.]